MKKNGKKTIIIVIAIYIVLGCTALGISIYDKNAEDTIDTFTESLDDADMQDESAAENDTEDIAESTVEDIEAADAEDAMVSDDADITEDETYDSEDAEVADAEAAEADDDSIDTATDDTEAGESDGTDKREGPYYRYTVNSLPFEGLSLYDNPDGDYGKVGYLRAGDTGYAIEKGKRRTLIDVDGNLSFVSNMYITLTEVSAEEYPDELKYVTWDSYVGTNGTDDDSALTEE